MAEYIECRHCTSLNCNGCNIYTLSIMLREGKFDLLMDNSRSIDQTACVVKAIPVDFQPVGTKCPTGEPGPSSTDVVEVVRCKDCKRRELDSLCEYFGDNDFCSNGERRADP